MEKYILSEVKRIIENETIDVLQTYWIELQDYDIYPDWTSLFQKIYIYACLKKKSIIASWLQTTIFPLLDPIQQIAVRQTFAYGKYLLQK